MNWTKITRELMAIGVRQQEIAKTVGCSQAAVSTMARGNRKTDIPFERAQRLLSLHRARVGSSEQEGAPHA